MSILPAHAAASPEPTSPAESASKLGAVARVSETGADVEQIEAAGLLQFFSLAPDPYCQGGSMILTASAKCGPRLAPPSKKREKSQAQKRRYHSAAFKLEVVREAMQRPVSSRIKPTCRNHPEVEACQLRKWIQQRERIERIAAASGAA